ncbi:MAG: DUF4339 domain-containing protein, partial [Planctomycetaceae bacterium]|nr:DUF4339 domain-containing protein [Planctomycetaceae bacterium]
MSTEWFYRIGEDEHGPIPSKALKLLADVGQITPSTLVRKTTSKSWAEAHHVKQLFDAQNTSQRSITAPQIIGQSSDSKHEQPVPVQLPTKVRAVNKPPPLIPTAELATPESTAFLPQINIVTTPHLNGTAPDDSSNPNNTADGANRKNNNSKRPLTLVLTLVGLIILTIPTAWYLHSKPSKIADSGSTQVNRYPAASANIPTTDSSNSTVNSTPNHSYKINNIFTNQPQWIDPTNDTLLTHGQGASLSITHVWLDMQQTEHHILNIIIKIENLNKSTELSLQRQFANQNATDRSFELSPYVPLISLATSDGHTLDSETQLVNRTIPIASEISETYQIELTDAQTAGLNQLRVAVPKAWFNKSGYWGFEIPQVMITATKPTKPPVQIASELNSDRGNFVNTKPSNVAPENIAAPKPPADGNGVLPTSPFGNNDPKPKEANGDQPKEANGDQPKEANGDQPKEANGDQPKEANGDQPKEANG